MPQAQQSTLDLKTPISFDTQHKYVDLHYKMKEVGVENYSKKTKIRKIKKNNCPGAGQEGLWKTGVIVPYIPKLGSKWTQMVTLKCCLFYS
jgi:hypothetical protein